MKSCLSSQTQTKNKFWPQPWPSILMPHKSRIIVSGTRPLVGRLGRELALPIGLEKLDWRNLNPSLSSMAAFTFQISLSDQRPSRLSPIPLTERKAMDLSKFSTDSQAALAASQKVARARHHQAVEPEHLAISLLENEQVQQMLRKSGRDPEGLRTLIEAQLGAFPKVPGSRNYLSPQMLGMLSTVPKSAEKNGEKLASVATLMGHVIASNNGLGVLLREQGRLNAEVFGTATVTPKGGRAGGAVEAGESLIDKLCVNLTAKAREGRLDQVVGRKNEIDRLIQILLCQGKNNALLVGKSGVGKTSVIRGLVHRVVSGEVQESLKGLEFFQLSISDLLAGSSLRGQFEEKAKSLMDDLAKRPNAVLVVANIESALGAGGEGNSDLSSVFKTAMAAGELRILGTIGTDAMRNKVAKDKSFARWFQTVDVEEPSHQETGEIMRGLKGKLEQHHGLRIDDSAIDFAVPLAQRYFNSSHLPDSVIGVVDLACSRLKANGLGDQLTKEAVAAYVAEATGIPVAMMSQTEKQKMLGMEKEIGKKLIGQKDAVHAVAEAVRRSRSGLSDPNRPIGSFLFLGSSGVGKSELALSIAEFLFDGQSSLLRIDCAELTSDASISRLVGSATGYIGSEQGGQLTNFVAKNKYCVILADEWEKAAQSIHTLFLAVMDAGRLTDGQGNLIDFRNTVIIATTNVGGPELLAGTDAHGNISEDARAAAMKKLQSAFKPEVLGRLESQICFHSLTKENLKDIAEIQFDKLRKVLALKDIDLELDEKAKHFVTERGFMPLFGARPLKNSVSKHLQNPLSTFLLENEFEPGAKIVVSASKEKLTFEKA